MHLSLLVCFTLGEEIWDLSEDDEENSIASTLEKSKESGTISTSVHRKITCTDKYLDFSSHLSHKKAVVSTLLKVPVY